MYDINKTYEGLVATVDNCVAWLEHDVWPEKSMTSTACFKYAYSDDNYIDAILENRMVHRWFRTMALESYGKQLEVIAFQDSRLTQSGFPRVWRNFQYCVEELELSKQPAFYVTSKLCGINALSVEMKSEPAVLLSYPAAVKLTDLEQRFVIGHELGHIQSGHLAAHVVQGLLARLDKHSKLLGAFMKDITDVPLNRWYRASEFSADRAGYLCCKDFSAVLSVFKKVKEKALKTNYCGITEMYKDHPFVATRIAVLEKYIKRCD